MKINIRKFTEKENSTFGVFISHSNAEFDLVTYVTPLATKMKESNIQPVYDREFLNQGDDFKTKILKYITCYAAVIVLSKNSVNSSWVNYEIGRLSGKKIKILIYDPENIINKSTEFVYLTKYLPAFSDLDSLIEELKKTSLYSDIFRYESVSFTKKMFWDACENKLERAMLTIEDDLFENNKALFERVTVGLLLTHFGEASIDIDEQCPEKIYSLDSSKHDINGCCVCSKHNCALKKMTEINDSNIECINLTKPLFSGHIFFKNDIDPYKDEGGIFHTSCIKAHLPIHKICGTTFKMFMDCPTQAEAEEVVNAFRGTKYYANISSRGGNRVYIALPSVPDVGLYKEKTEYMDSFVCPFCVNK